MAWIHTTKLAEATGELRQQFTRALDPQSGELDNIMSIHSAHPAGLGAHFDLYNAVMRPTKSLPKLEREMIALVVGTHNACHY